MSKPFRVIGLHVCAWALFFLYEWVFKQSTLQNPAGYLREFYFVAIRIAVLIVTVYFTLLVLVPRLLERGRRLAFAGATLATVTLAALLMRTLNYHLLVKHGPVGLYAADILDVRGLGIYIGNITFNVCFVLMFYFLRRWAGQQQKSRALEAAMQEAGLQLLKAQVQPHFLFNTLNNIYALAEQNSPHTAAMIYRLSGLLEYMLYDSVHAWVPLDREIAYIRSYVALEQIRYSQRLDVALNLYELPAAARVPSLTLLPFVENSFKHGLSQQTGPCWLRVDVSVVQDWLHVNIENSVPSPPPPPARGKGGLGIVNIRQRLNLLYGPTGYELRLLSSPDTFLVLLRLRLMPPPTAV